MRAQDLLCASHDGSDEHVQVAASIQAGAVVREADPECGVHMLLVASAYEVMITRGEVPIPNLNNCSGKHGGMLASASLHQLNALTPEARSALSDFGPSLPVKDHRGRTAGISRPIFHLSKDI